MTHQTIRSLTTALGTVTNALEAVAGELETTKDELHKVTGKLAARDRGVENLVKEIEALKAQIRQLDP